MASTRMSPGHALLALLVLEALIVTSVPPRAGADEAPRAPKPATQPAPAAQPGPKPADQPKPNAPAARSADQVLDSLNRAMSWYRQARIVMRPLAGTAP